MTDIPSDIQATVDKFFFPLAVFDWCGSRVGMANAILAERERCAKIAENAKRYIGPVGRISGIEMAGLIADDIRQGKQS